ncbi:MAG TPA: hypothetical protein VLV16_14750 [Gemmatimonadales bacterium]|nr:hypothetical protein [Gemmatimonadales bacterium]
MNLGDRDDLDDARLRELAQRLGARAADTLDVERTAAAVLERLREAPARRRMPIWLPIAAGLVLLLGAGVVWRATHRAPAPAVAAAGYDLKTLSPDQLRQLLQVIDQPLDVDSVTADDTTWDDLTAPELRHLLAVLEG